MLFFHKPGIVNVKMIITEEKILSNIDKVQKMINPNNKKQIVQLDEDAYFKDLIDSIKTYLTEYPKKKNFPASVYKASYGLVEYATNQFEENTKQIEKLMQEQMLEAFSFIYARYNDDYYCNNYFVTGIFETSIDIYLYTQVDPLTIDFSLNIISEDNNFFIQKESHWWDSIVNFFKNIIQKIKSLFSR